ncbi:hypothetical protein ACFODL_06220 [Phenylobacterium terrae]|uniref:Uncharacterized protein n=1 Tax=Phenylobacterium terrae TaxID=2665495 RepID=A0ABW4N5X5_9CAUL
MKYLVVTALWLVATPAMSQMQGEPIIVGGPCDPKSGVTIDDGETSQFSCDTAVIARTDRGSVLIQFTDRSGDDGRILGFAGTIEGKQGFGAEPVQAVAVERLYLAGGADPIPVTRGSCFMNWTGLHRTGGVLTSVVCGAAGRAEGSDVRAMAALEVR